ncbi:MAG: hypothetical protein ACLQM8_21135 [Limisphaerales bacterium]
MTGWLIVIYHRRTFTGWTVGLMGCKRMARIEEIRVDPWHPWFIFSSVAALPLQESEERVTRRWTVCNPCGGAKGDSPSEETDVRCEILRGCKAALGGSDYNYMSLAEIPPEIRSLPAAEQLRLIRLLAEQVDAEGGVAPLEHGWTCIVSTPVFEPGASGILQRELETAPHH